MSIRVRETTRSEAPCTDYYDPCPAVPCPSVDDFYNGLIALRPNANMLYNRFPYGKLDIGTPLAPSFFEKISQYLAVNPIAKFDEVIRSISFTPTERKRIEKITRGQVDNPNWFNYREGMLTASKFNEATHMLPSTNPDKFVRNLVSSGNHFGENVALVKSDKVNPEY